MRMLNEPRVEMKYNNNKQKKEKSTTANDRVDKEPKDPLFIIFVKHFQLKDSRQKGETNQAQHIYITARQLNTAESFYIRLLLMPLCLF